MTDGPRGDSEAWGLKYSALRSKNSIHKFWISDGKYGFIFSRVSSMALILEEKKSPYRRWYEKNQQTLSERRKKRYAEDSEYRQRAIERSQRRRRGEVTLTTPPADAPISFGEAAKHIGVGKSTLDDWRSKKYFPEPKHYNGRRLWFTEKQVLLLKELKDRVYGKRRWYMKFDRFKEVVASISANWD
jgi:predicted DNA-binding transcriptional regulator AlpA